MNKENALDQLRREVLPKGRLVYAVRVNHGCKSKRQYIFFRPLQNEIQDITWLIAMATDTRRHAISGGIITNDAIDLIALLSIRLGYEPGDLHLHIIA